MPQPPKTHCNVVKCFELEVIVKAVEKFQEPDTLHVWLCVTDQLCMYACELGHSINWTNIKGSNGLDKGPRTMEVIRWNPSPPIGWPQELMMMMMMMHALILIHALLYTFSLYYSLEDATFKFLCYRCDIILHLGLHTNSLSQMRISTHILLYSYMGAYIRPM